MLSIDEPQVLKRCRSGAFTPTSWKGLSLTSEEGDKEKWIVLVWVLLSTETKARLTSFIGRKHSEVMGKEIGRGEKPIKYILIWGLLLWDTGGQSHWGPSEEPQRTCLQIDSPKNEESGISTLWLPPLIEGWSLAIASLGPSGLPCGQAEQAPCHWRELSSTKAERCHSGDGKQSACTRTLPQRRKGTQTLATGRWKALITRATREETVSAMSCFTF